jgi:chromosome segregation ATPase
MNKYILLLVLISGFLSGYLIGDYRGSYARESLKMAVETGKVLVSEREATLTQLKAELDGIADKHQRELEVIRKDNANKAAEWRRTRNGLDDSIKRATAKLNESDIRLKSLVARRDGTSGSVRASLDLEIAHLQKERDNLKQEIEGNACLQTRLPHSVFEALNETKVAGIK